MFSVHCTSTDCTVVLFVLCIRWWIIVSFINWCTGNVVLYNISRGWRVRSGCVWWRMAAEWARALRHAVRSRQRRQPRLQRNSAATPTGGFRASGRGGLRLHETNVSLEYTEYIRCRADCTSLLLVPWTFSFNAIAISIHNCLAARDDAIFDHWSLISWITVLLTSTVLRVSDSISNRLCLRLCA